MQRKRTKIIATLGPSSTSPDVIKQLIEAGANAFRLNFSHGAADDHVARVKVVRDIARSLNQHVALMGDLQGPKIRIGRFAEGREPDLKEGDEFVLDCARTHPGDGGVVGVTYPALAEDCHAGQVLLLDDGRIELLITEIDRTRIRTRTLIGGLLSSSKGINLRDGGLSAPALTEKDIADIELAVKLDLDYLAVSFPRSVEDIQLARKAMRDAGCKAKLVSKIERAEAVADDAILDEMIRMSDAVMVARGDLGVEIGDSELIGVQKKMIKRARHLNRVVITATQMMESMIESPLPTRAEVFDVANAVLDGTDVVMLSGETAMGKYPVKVVEAMTRIIQGAEKHSVSQPVSTRRQTSFTTSDEAIAVSAMFAANHYPEIKAIVCLTESGSTPLRMSRIRSGMPIYAFSREDVSLQRMALYRGVNARKMTGDPETEMSELLEACLAQLKEEAELEAGELVIATTGEHLGEMGGTNTLKILRVP